MVMGEIWSTEFSLLCMRKLSLVVVNETLKPEMSPRCFHISPRPRQNRDVGKMHLETEMSRPRLYPC